MGSLVFMEEEITPNTEKFSEASLNFSTGGGRGEHSYICKMESISKETSQAEYSHTPEDFNSVHP